MGKHKTVEQCDQLCTHIDIHPAGERELVFSPQPPLAVQNIFIFRLQLLCSFCVITEINSESEPEKSSPLAAQVLPKRHSNIIINMVDLTDAGSPFQQSIPNLAFYVPAVVVFTLAGEFWLSPPPPPFVCFPSQQPLIPPTLLMHVTWPRSRPDLELGQKTFTKRATRTLTPMLVPLFWPQLLDVVCVWIFYYYLLSVLVWNGSDLNCV